MATCLGIYIDKNIIKYAKITKDKTSTKIDAFGVEIYSNLKQAISKIIEETFSFKIPISINLSDEMYNYFYMSDLLNKNDLKKAIKTEFESYCYDKGLNPNALENRYALVNDVNDKGKIRVIDISVDKIKLNNLFTDFEGHKVTTVTPLSLSIANIAPLNPKENIAIVNIESKTTVTIITGEKAYEIKNIDLGSQKILDTISQKENSYKKAYEICKNTTIYTMQGKELQETENEYLSDIVPDLYQVATEVNEIVNTSLVKINKVYLTGTGSLINNIDLYFEELLTGVKCEILKPFFIEDSPRINMKDYIEVNSAISLALQGLNYGIKDINFSNQKSSGFSSISIGKEKSTKSQSSEETNGFLSKLNNINISNSKISTWLVRLMSTSVIAFVAYVAIVLVINSQIISKANETQDVIDDTNKQITKIKSDTKLINAKITEYDILTKNLQNATASITEKNSYKYIIPVLLSEITTYIPQEVQLTSIENPNGRKIIINAQSKKYEQLAYFKAKLKAEGILEPTSVVSSEAVKENDLVKIVIEGELP